MKLEANKSITNIPKEAKYIGVYKHIDFPIDFPKKYKVWRYKNILIIDRGPRTKKYDIGRYYTMSKIVFDNLMKLVNSL